MHRLSHVLFPWLPRFARQQQIRGHEAGQTRFGLGATAHGTFITNLATGARGGTRVRRDGRGVIMSLDFSQDRHRLSTTDVHVWNGGR